MRGSSGQKSIGQPVDAWQHVSRWTEQLALTPAFPEARVTVSAVKRSCHKIRRVIVCVCERESERMNKKVCCVSPLQWTCMRACVWTPFPREVAFILCPFTAATWWESPERDTIPSSGGRTEGPFSAPEGPREREPLCLLVRERWPLTPSEATEMERGQASVHLPLIILGLSPI